MKKKKNNLKQMELIGFHKQHQFLKNVITALHMELCDFEKSVAKKNPYETMIKNWTNDLYNDGISLEDAIQIIYQKRFLHFQKIPLFPYLTP